MPDVSNRQRHPSGIPQGGEFKNEHKGVDADDLMSIPADWSIIFSDEPTIITDEEIMSMAATNSSGACDDDALSIILQVPDDELLSELDYAPTDIPPLIRLAENPVIPDEMMNEFAVDEDEELRAAVARNPDIPEHLLVKLAEDDSESVRETVAQHPKTPVETLVMFVGNRSEETSVIRAAAVNPNFPRHRLPALIANGYAVAAQNPNIPAPVLARLAENSDGNIREAVAANLNTPAETLATLAKDSANNVCYSAAQNPNTPVPTLVKLAEETYDSQMQVCLSGNPSMPAETLASLAEYPEAGRLLKMVLAGNSSTPDRVLKKLIQSGDRIVRNEAFNNPSLSSQTLAQFARSSEKNIRDQARATLWLRQKRQ